MIEDFNKLILPNYARAPSKGGRRKYSTRRKNRRSRSQKSRTRRRYH